MNVTHHPDRKNAVWNFTPVPHVKRIVAVASGKGGVGKSTLTVNLAHALAAQGLRVGILDADIYGPSIPRMMGLSSAAKPELLEGMMQPHIAHGIACMSIGFVIGDEAAIMRGPMITKTLYQLLRLTRWGSEAAPLDILLVDMPPGTGDIHLSMAQQVPLDGAIIITTPQKVATIDAEKVASMFVRIRVKLLGVVENMSGGMFGSGGGASLAAQLGVPLLGTIGMDAALCASGDSGERFVGDAFQPIAAALL